MTSGVYLHSGHTQLAQEITRRAAALPKSEDQVLLVQQLLEDTFAKGVHSNRADLIVAAAREASGVLAQLGNPAMAQVAFNLSEAATRLEFDQNQKQRELQLFQDPPSADDLQVAQLRATAFEVPPSLKKAITGIGPLAAVLRMKDAHNMWLRAELDRAVLPDERASQPARAAQDDVAIRPWARAWDDLKDSALAEMNLMNEGWLPEFSEGDSSLDVWGAVLNRNWAGTLGGLQGVLDLGEPDLEDKTAGEAYVQAARALPNMLDTIVKPSEKSAKFHLDPSEKAFLKNLKSELYQVWEWAESLKGDAPKHVEPKVWRENFPLTWCALAGSHDRYVQRNVTDASREPNPDNVVPFLQQSLKAQLRNLPSVISAVDGLLHTDHLIQGFMKGKTDAKDELLAALQDQLILSQKSSPAKFRDSQAARFQLKNTAHARAVSDLASLGMAEMFKRQDLDPERQLTLFERVHPVLFQAAEASGALNQTKKTGDAASLAPHVALEFLPQVFRAVGFSGRDATKQLTDILSRARVEDYIELGARFDRSFGGSADELKTELTQKFGEDPYFGAAFNSVRVRSQDDRPLSSRELDRLEVALRVFNVTWISQQVHRATTDASRGDLIERGGVYNYYDNMVQAPGSPFDSVVNLMKDAAVGLEALALI